MAPRRTPFSSVPTLSSTDNVSAGSVRPTDIVITLTMGSGGTCSVGLDATGARVVGADSGAIGAGVVGAGTGAIGAGVGIFSGGRVGLEVVITIRTGATTASTPVSLSPAVPSTRLSFGARPDGAVGRFRLVYKNQNLHTYRLFRCSQLSL
jgi:hypothetical protein